MHRGHIQVVVLYIEVLREQGFQQRNIFWTKLRLGDARKYLRNFHTHAKNWVFDERSQHQVALCWRQPTKGANSGRSENGVVCSQ